MKSAGKNRSEQNHYSTQANTKTCHASTFLFPFFYFSMKYFVDSLKFAFANLLSNSENCEEQRSNVFIMGYVTFSLGC